MILTFYVGQVIEIRKTLKENNINDIKVSSVDNYQGEECDIILLSLVRSNKKHEIGFLRSFNRVCVAFSRAKKGFYIIGNIDCIIEAEKKLEQRKIIKTEMEEKMKDVWRKINKKAIELNCIGNELVLCCQNHNKKTVIKDVKDFSLVIEGGCQETCKQRLKCGHVCDKSCHAYSHERIQCYKPCAKNFEECGHQCQKNCYEDCGECEELVSKKLPCGHYIHKIKCGKNISEIKCEVTVEKKLLCGHISKVNCGTPLTEIVCDEKCDVKLKCGHDCRGTCGECLQGTLHKKCGKECGKVLFCGHVCKEKCSGDCLCREKCPNICAHGYCEDPCSEKCVPCTEFCKLECKHTRCNKKCGEICDRDPCNNRCDKKMKCGHQCYGLCGERCPNICKICEPKNVAFEIFYGNEDDDDALFYKTKCGHIIEYRGMDKYLENQREIKMYQCPKCTSLLIDEPRYQKYIKKRFEESQRIKE